MDSTNGFFIWGMVLILSGQNVDGMIFFTIIPVNIVFSLVVSRMSAKRNYKLSKFYSDADRIIYILNDKGMEYKTNISSMFIQWEQVYRAYDTNYSFFIMQDNQRGYILDKKYMTKEQNEEIKFLLEEKLERKRFKSRVSKNKVIQYLNEAAAVQIENTNVTEGIVERDDSYDVTVTTTITLDTCMKFNKFHMFKGWNMVIIIYFPIMFLFISSLNFLSNDIIQGTIFLVIGLLLVPAMIFLPMLLSKKFVKKNFKSNKYLASVTNIFYGFSDEGITQLSQNCHANFKWNQLYKVYEVKDYFYMYVSRRQAYVIFKNDFQQGDVEKVKKILNSKLTKKQNRTNFNKDTGLCL